MQLAPHTDKHFTNILWNFLGLLLPGVLILACIPVAIRNLGEERFGLLSLAWGLLGYLGLLDFGMSRSLTHSIAKKLSQDEHDKIDADISTTTLLLLGFGSGIALLFFLTEPLWLTRVFKSESIPSSEIALAVVWILIGIPLTLASTGLRGALEAFGRFDISNVLRVPLSFVTYGFPALISLYTRRIDIGISLIILSRFAGLIVYLIFIKKLRKNLSLRQFDKHAAKQLLHYGGWLAVTSFISPIMYQMDRLFISATIGIAAVAYYTTPMELVTKIWLAQGAVLYVTFPALTVSKSSAPKVAAELYRKSLHLILLISVPAVAAFLLFSREILSLWINPDFADKSALIMAVLSVGALLNCVAQVPYTLIQSWGRPDITAKFHMIQLPIYLCFFYWLIHAYGIFGAAIAWTGRTALDTLMLSVYARKYGSWANTVPHTLGLGAASLTLVFVAPLMGLEVRILLLTALATGIVYVFFFTEGFQQERQTIRGLLKK
jgi:O-antigen/teichoic acid export membrane protein